MTYHRLQDLEPNLFYELQVIAVNELGRSDADSQFIFSTAADGLRPTSLSVLLVCLTTHVSFSSCRYIGSCSVFTVKYLPSSLSPVIKVGFFWRRMLGPDYLGNSVRWLLKWPHVYDWDVSIMLTILQSSCSVLQQLFHFHSPGGDSRPVREPRTTPNVTLVIVIVVGVVVVFLAIVDVSCYFMNSCGVTMFVCVHVCGQQPHTAADRSAEELER